MWEIFSEFLIFCNLFHKPLEKINSMSIVRIGVTYNRDDRREQKERIETKAKRNHKKNRRTERE